MSDTKKFNNPKWFKNNQDILEDLYWVASENDPKTCPICRTRNSKTPKQIEELKDGYPIETPCHKGCRCDWAPKTKSWSELLGPKLSKGMRSEIELPTGPVKPVPYEKWSNDYVSPGGFVSIHAEVSYGLPPLEGPSKKKLEKLQKEADLFIEKVTRGEITESPDPPMPLDKNEVPFLQEPSKLRNQYASLDEGIIVLTNQRIIFIGKKQKCWIDLKSISSITSWAKDIEIKTINKNYIFSVQNPLIWNFAVGGFIKGQIKLAFKKPN